MEVTPAHKRPFKGKITLNGFCKWVLLVPSKWLWSRKAPSGALFFTAIAAITHPQKFLAMGLCLQHDDVTNVWCHHVRDTVWHSTLQGTLPKSTHWWEYRTWQFQTYLPDCYNQKVPQSSVHRQLATQERVYLLWCQNFGMLQRYLECCPQPSLSSTSRWKLFCFIWQFLSDCSFLP